MSCQWSSWRPCKRCCGRRLSNKNDCPADLLSFDLHLAATVRVTPLEATVSVAALILKLRQVALDRRASETQANCRCSVPPNPDSPLTHEEVGWVLALWKGKFHEQAMTQEQARQDWRENCSRSESRKQIYIPKPLLRQSQTCHGAGYLRLQRQPARAGHCLCRGNRCRRCFELAALWSAAACR